MLTDAVTKKRRQSWPAGEDVERDPGSGGVREQRARRREQVPQDSGGI